MIVLYTHSNNRSFRNALEWFKTKDIPIKVRKIRKANSITKQELLHILSLTEKGFEDILSSKSGIYNKLRIDSQNFSTNELLNLIMENPSLLRTPLITEKKKLLIGYNDTEIRCFVPKRNRYSILYAYYNSEKNMNSLMR
ncbi:Spx/MgsR family RNA polymerase-binding regulatory protein [Enterococcus avium]|uniref:Spx/MgsR family RNA polymerase-binding regulatory protein n=1 Tax=Enterococcus avium TaxID=33945 RepID=UPI001F55C685|nr:Spx/MgsR family RNA polymerase-binding regulatory protein [Enterococcus avium]